MVQVILYGWQNGLVKVSLTKLQMEILEISLKVAKTNTDKLLNNSTVIIEITRETQAEYFKQKAEAIGAKVRIVQN